VDKSRGRLTVSLNAEFIAGFRGRQLSEILNAAETREIRARQIIIREGAPAAHLFLVKSGRVKFYRLSHSGDEVLLSTLLPGDAFGLGALFAHPVPYIGTAEATRDSELVVWRHARVRPLAQKYPRLSQNALGIVLRHLNEHFDHLFSLMTGTAAERLAGVVLQLGKQSGLVIPAGVEVNATNDELAAQAHISPFTVSRFLSNWERKGALSKSRGKIFIKSPERLLAG